MILWLHILTTEMLFFNCAVDLTNLQYVCLISVLAELIQKVKQVPMWSQQNILINLINTLSYIDYR